MKEKYSYLYAREHYHAYRLAQDLLEKPFGMADAKLIAEIVTEKFSGEDLQQYIAMLIANVSFGVMQDAKKQVVDVRVKVGPVSLSRGSEER